MDMILNSRHIPIAVVHKFFAFCDGKLSRKRFEEEM